MVTVKSTAKALIFICAVLTLSSFLCSAAQADETFYMRAGGTAFHCNRNCPALKGFKVIVVEDFNNMVPCRICYTQDYVNQAESATRARERLEYERSPEGRMEAMQAKEDEKERERERKEQALRDHERFDREVREWKTSSPSTRWPYTSWPYPQDRRYPIYYTPSGAVVRSYDAEY